jgi:ubiquinone/menaquinone biosynthesis C-methylase UbiE
MLWHYFPDDSVVLEIGCEIGRIMYHVAPHGRELHGVDISAEMIEQASANLAYLPNMRLHAGTGFELPAQAGQFDLAYSKYQQFLQS